MRVAILGAGSGGMAAIAELANAGHTVRLWNRSSEALAPLIKAGRVRYRGVLGEGNIVPEMMSTDLNEVIRDCDAAVIVLPTFAHAPLAKALANADWPADRPVILNPGHTGGALEFVQSYGMRNAPPVAEFSTLTYVARKSAPDCVNVTSRAPSVRSAALPGGEAALEAAELLFPGASRQVDVLASSLSNVNMILHPPGAIFGAAWVEATRGDFTFYVQGMTLGVGRVMQSLDDERRAVARACGHELPNVICEMQRLGTVSQSINPDVSYIDAISAGEANSRIKAPDSLAHRYYREDFGHGLLPFLEIARIAGVSTPIAESLFTLAQNLVGTDYRASGRTAAAMGISNISRDELMRRVRS